MKGNPSAYYTSKIALCDKEINKYERLINIYSLLRLLAFLFGIFLVYQSLKLDRIWATELAFLSAVFGFAYLVKRQSLLEKKKNYFSDLRKINTNEINILNRQSSIYPDGASRINGLHPYTSDLDIFGKGSLFAMLNRCSTEQGNDKLAGWLSAPASIDEIKRRQSGVQEIASKPDWRQNFQAVLLFINKSDDNTPKLFQYLRITPISHSKPLQLYIRLAPWLFITFAALSYYVSWFLLAVIVMGITNAFISLIFNSLVMKAMDMTGKMSKTLEHFHGAIHAIREEPWRSTVCSTLADELKNEKKGKFPDQVKRLSVLINRMELLQIGLIAPILYFASAWGVRQLFAMEQWKRNNNLNLEEAFDIIAFFEALTSLSSLKNNYPEFCVPEIRDDEHYTLNAEDIGHPLIPAEVRISNNFTLNNELKIDIITGSNMAGKSTFLRTLGINSVLALCGAPVCAKSMSLTPMLIFSYMRIADSLNESTSTFKAELDRLKLLLDTLEKEEKVYFLIDEMLRGTNSVDKYRGSKAVIEKLIAQNAVGIVATHDLQIAQLEQKYPDYIRNFYFDIRVEKEEMKFDYKLKAGECKTFNASLLLQQLGINVEEVR